MKIKLLLFVVSTFICTQSRAQLDIFTGKTVTYIADHLSERVESILRETDAIMSKQTFDIRQNLSILIGELDYIADKNINKVYEKLSETQRQFFNHAESLISSIEEGQKVLVNDLEDAIDKANAFAGTLPFSKKEPTVTKLSRSYFGEQDFTNIFEVEGAWLSHGKPYVSVNGEKFYTIGKLDSKLEFQLPFDKWVDSTKLKQISVELVVFHKKTFRTVQKKYQLMFYLVPNQYGSYTLSTKVVENERVEKKVNRSFSHRNDHCQGGTTKIWTFDSQGLPWKIDVTSINDRASSVSRDSQYRGVRRADFNGFQIEGRVVNHGDCGPFWKDARGSISGNVTWTEFRINPVSVDNGVISQGSLLWTDDIVFELPENLSSFRLELKLINGKTIILTESQHEDWLEVDYNPIAKTLKIKPKTLERALSN